MEGRVVCQWDKDSIDDARMIKIDFLALGMLSAVDECLDIIAARRGERPDLGRIPHNDPAIYERICRGRHGRSVPDREPCPDPDAAEDTPSDD
ncbi:MAG: hypothetical protein KatS3mg060_3075 [Dehalococcoidia bacterium]|nr:MAG: hypothetical protein KatS3mg060_3075 [Dehalococcoidia bacterium]